MYVYYNNEGVLKTQIPHGEIVRQGGDFNLRVCFEPDFADWDEVLLAAQVLLTDNKTTTGYQTARDGEDILFEKANDAEVTYALIPGNPYKAFDFSWKHLEWPEVTNKSGNIKVSVTAVKITRNFIEATTYSRTTIYYADENGTPLDDQPTAETFSQDTYYEEAEPSITDTLVNGVIPVCIEAVFGYIPGATIDGSDEHYRELTLEDAWLQKQINDIVAFTDTKQDRYDPKIQLNSNPPSPDTDWSVAGALNNLQGQINSTNEQMKTREIWVGQYNFNSQYDAESLEYTLPSDAQMLTFIEGVEEATGKTFTEEIDGETYPLNGDVVIVIQKIEGATDRVYKYIYSANDWIKYEIPAIEPAKFDSLGSVSGTYYVSTPQSQPHEEDYPLLVDIDNGVIKNIYLKGTYFVKATEWEDNREYFIATISGFTPVANPVKTDLANYWIQEIEETYSDLESLLANKVSLDQGYITNIEIDGLTLKFTFVNGKEFSVQIIANETAVRTLNILDDESELTATSQDLISGKVAYQLRNNSKKITYSADAYIKDFALDMYNEFSDIEYIEMPITIPVDAAEVSIDSLSMNVNGTTYNIGEYNTGTHQHSDPATDDGVMLGTTIINRQIVEKIIVRFYPSSCSSFRTNDYADHTQVSFEGHLLERMGTAVATGLSAQNLDVIPLTFIATNVQRGSNEYGFAYIYKSPKCRDDMKIEKGSVSDVGQLSGSVRLLGRSVVVRYK